MLSNNPESRRQEQEMWARHIAQRMRRWYSYQLALRQGVDRDEYVKATLAADGATKEQIDLVLRYMQSQQDGD